MFKQLQQYSHTLKNIAALLQGQSCAVCALPCVGDVVCGACLNLIIQRNDKINRCHQCAMPVRPIPSELELSELYEGTYQTDQPIKNKSIYQCNTCVNKPPAFDNMVCLGNFSNPLGQLISQFKFSRHLILSQLFAKQLHAELLKQAFALTSFDMIVPIPLHPNRLRERGFNQSWEIIRHLPYSNTQKQHALIRLVDTPSQRKLDTAGRINNMKYAFAVPHSQADYFNPLKHQLKHKNILLIDDVVTTTATVQAACLALKEAGVASVTVACLARVDHVDDFFKI